MNIPRRVLWVTGLAVACGPGVEPETVYTMHPPTWFEDGWSYYDVARNGNAALFGARFGISLIDLERHSEENTRFNAGVDQITSAGFDAEGRLVRLGVRNGDSGWFVEEGDDVTKTPLPRDAVPKWSPNGSLVAYTRSGQDAVFVGAPGGVSRYGVDGAVTGLGWSPESDVVFAMVAHDNGLSSLLGFGVESGDVEVVREDLDATVRFNSIGVSADGAFLYIALAGAEVPDAEARHQPDADRDMDIYRLDVATGEVRVVVDTPGDDFYPDVVNGHLYWTHNEIVDAVVVIPAEGGEARVVVEDAQIPYWSHDGGQLGFTYGGWRVADWALNLDAGVVAVDDEARAVGEPTPIVVGYHEDFTPAWSPDGRWMAYHSHRSTTPVAAYAAAGTTDDIYLLRTGAPVEEEIRLTDFGWEVGMADWAPDGRRLVFDSWEQDAPGASKPWIVTIDPSTGQAVDLERLSLPDGFNGTLLAAWSPLGGEIAVVERIQGEQQALWVLSVDGEVSEKLLDIRASTYGGVDWTPDGQRLVYAALSDGRMQLYSLPRSGGQPQQLTRDRASLIQPQVSPDGRWIAATRVYRSKELRRLRL